MSAAYVVTVMIKTWLGATYRTDALCRSLSVFLHLIYLDHQIDPHCVLLSSTQSCKNYISADVQHTKSQRVAEHLKHATDLPNRDTINHAKSTT